MRVGRVRDKDIGLREARQERVVVARVVEVEQRRVIVDLPGTLKGASLIAAVGRRVARCARVRLAPGVVPNVSHLLRAAVQRHGGGAEMVGERPEDTVTGRVRIAADARGNALVVCGLFNRPLSIRAVCL